MLKKGQAKHTNKKNRNHRPDSQTVKTTITADETPGPS